MGRQWPVAKVELEVPSGKSLEMVASGGDETQPSSGRLVVAEVGGMQLRRSSGSLRLVDAATSQRA